jgi:hypothetical protein
MVRWKVRAWRKRPGRDREVVGVAEVVASNARKACEMAAEILEIPSQEWDDGSAKPPIVLRAEKE